MIISHRGNIIGSKPKFENDPNYIDEALNLNVQLEIDIWLIKNKWFLGHDSPKFKLKEHFFADSNLVWFHCKNIEALVVLLEDEKINNVFWHQEDNFSLTKNNYIWTYPGQPITRKSIIMDKDLNQYKKKDYKMAYGVCTDYPLKAREYYE